MKYHLRLLGTCCTALLIVATAFVSYGCNDVSTAPPPPPQPPSPDSQLSSLTVTPGTLNPTFVGTTTSYTVDLTSTITSVTVAAQTQHSGATVGINGSKATTSQQSQSVNLGGPGSSTPITIIVTAPNGTQTTYVVAVNRASLAGNNSLQSLTVLPGTLNPTFDANTLNYSVDVASTVASVTATATLQDTNAAMTVNGQATNSGQAQIITLGGPGSSTLVTILVTAPNGNQKNYRVDVNKGGANNANLTNLTVTPVNITGFSPANTGPYPVDVNSGVNSVTVTATKADASANVFINSVAGTSRTINLPPAPSSTQIEILVIAQDGTTTKTYVVNVNRLGANNANLTNLTVTPVNITGFSPANTGPYPVDVNSGVNSVTVTATKADANATVFINGLVGTSQVINLPGAPSTTQINVQVIAQDGTTTKTYVVNVNRLGANNANLSNLTVTPVNITGFSPANTGPYPVAVNSTVGSVTVTATKADANANVFINSVAGTSRTINLPPAPSSTQIDVLVIAQDGTTTKTYVINVNRAGPLSNNANLSDLNVFAGATATPPALVLTPSFSSAITSYTTTQVANTVTQVTIVATRADSNATMTIGGVASTGQTTVGIGAAGSTTPILIVVIPPSGPADAKTYTVNVPKAP